MPSYSKLEGNRTFSGPVQIISGMNDRLTILAEPDEYTIVLPEGNFKSIHELVVNIDTSIYDKFPSIIFDVLPNITVLVQIENHSEITKVKGPGSFFL